jgi:hypothetical protein
MERFHPAKRGEADNSRDRYCDLLLLYYCFTTNGFTPRNAAPLTGHSLLKELPIQTGHVSWRMLTYADVCWRMLTDTRDILLKKLPIQTRLPSDSRSSVLTDSETEVQTGASSPTNSHSTASNISRQQVSLLALLVKK